MPHLGFIQAIHGGRKRFASRNAGNRSAIRHVHPLHPSGSPRPATLSRRRRIVSQLESTPTPNWSAARSLQLLQSSDPAERLRAVMQCRRTTHEQAAPVLIAAATRFEPEVQNRSFTAIALGNMPNARSYELLSTMLRTDDAGEVRASAAAGLGYLGDARALPELRLALLEDHHWSTRISAAVALGMLRDQRAVDVLMDGLRGAFTRSAAEKEALQRACIGSLGELGATAAMPQLLPFAQAHDFLTRQVLAEALGALMPSCNTPDTAAYRQAAEKCLQHLAQDAHTNVRDAAQIAWRRLADEAEKEGVE